METWRRISTREEWGKRRAYGAKPLLANQDDVNESGLLSRRPAGRTSAPPPGARMGGPLSMNWGICNWTA